MIKTLLVFIIMISFLFGCTTPVDISKEEAEEIATNFILSVSDDEGEHTVISTNSELQDNMWIVSLTILSTYNIISDQTTIEVIVDSNSGTVECVRSDIVEFCGDELAAEMGA